MSGTASEVCGMASATMSMKTQSDMKMVTPSVSFSPDSTGSVKPSRVMAEMSAEGATRFMAK